MKKVTLCVVMVVALITLCSCSRKDNGDKEKINRKAPKSMEELNVESADAVKWTRFDEKEMEITDKEKIDIIKGVFDKIRISEDDAYDQYDGGVHFDLFCGDKQLCFINLAGATETGRCIICNDTYEFIGEINKEEAKKLIDIVGEYDQLDENK